MAKQYVKLRGDNILVVGTKHVADHFHLHLIESATQLNGKSSRLSKKEHASIKQRLQEYQQQRYPFLSHSLPDHGKDKKQKTKEERTSEKFAERADLKHSLLELFETASKETASLVHLQAFLKEHGAVPYVRAGKEAGLEFGGYKFRYTRLGISERIKELSAKHEREQKQLKDIKSLRENRTLLGERLAMLTHGAQAQKQIIDSSEKEILQQFENLRDGSEHSLDEGLVRESNDYTNESNSESNANDNEEQIENTEADTADDEWIDDTNDGSDFDNDTNT